MAIIQGKHLTAFPKGMQSFNVDINAVTKSSAYTVVATTDSGKVFVTFTDNVVFTLPAIADGQVYRFINGAEDGAAKVSISPNAADGIMYVTATDNKDLINTKATAKKGDYVVIQNVAGTDYWSVTDARGVWAKEA